jgi:hypothetical protein
MSDNKMLRRMFDSEGRIKRYYEGDQIKEGNECVKFETNAGFQLEEQKGNTDVRKYY